MPSQCQLEVGALATASTIICSAPGRRQNAFCFCMVSYPHLARPSPEMQNPRSQNLRAATATLGEVVRFNKILMEERSRLCTTLFALSLLPFPGWYLSDSADGNPPLSPKSAIAPPSHGFSLINISIGCLRIVNPSSGSVTSSFPNVRASEHLEMGQDLSWVAHSSYLMRPCE